MEIVSCLNPVKVYRKASNDFILVPCGHCAACRVKRGWSWKTRIEDECRCWPYSFFFTLTYAEDNLPRMHYDKDSQVLVNLDSAECYNLCDVVTNVSDTINFLRKRKYVLPVLSVRDIQLFMKRFRYFCNQIQGSKNEDKKVRYYICGEYGPTTFRPHYHGILWFSSRSIAKEFNSLIRKAWSLGIVDFSPVNGNAAGYVAQYVNSFDSLPQIYKFRSFRQFALFSRRPPIGSLLPCEEEVLEVFYGAIVTRRRPSTDNSELVDIPLPAYVKNRLFPKITGFSNYSHYDRVNLYAIYNFAGKKDWCQFVEWFENLSDTQAYLPLVRLLNEFVDYRPYDEFGRYITPSVRLRNLNRLYRISRRVCEQAIIFQCSVSYYVDRIELFYDKCELYNLKQMYEFEKEFIKEHSLSYLVFIDPLFVDKAVEEFHNNLTTPAWIVSTLHSFGLSEDFLRDANIRDKFSLSSCPSYGKFKSLMYKILQDSTKTKVKNEYLDLHPEFRILH